jgi:hypothetical protein
MLSRKQGIKMTHDELLARIDELYRRSFHVNKEGEELYVANNFRFSLNALRAVVKLIQKKQKFLENTKGDIPMTNQQLGAREERIKLLAEIKQAIEKELG